MSINLAGRTGLLRAITLFGVIAAVALPWRNGSTPAILHSTPDCPRQGATSPSRTFTTADIPATLAHLSIAAEKAHGPKAGTLLGEVKKEFENKFRAVFQSRCGVCHGPGGLREDSPLTAFENIMENPALLLNSIRGDMGQYAQADRKSMIQWLSDSVIPAKEKSMAALEPQAQPKQLFEETDIDGDWQKNKKKIYPHPGNWIKGHRFSARVEEKSCFLCHQSQAFCIDCHNKTEPTDHLSRQWISQIHMIKGRVQPQRCASCHYANFCSQCHNRPFNR